MARRTINLSEKDLKKLEDLLEHFDAMSINDAIRRSISQTSALSKYADSDGALNVTTEDGDHVKVRVD